MKKNIIICVMLIISALWIINTNAQSTTNTNAWALGDYLGYNGITHDLSFGFGAGPTTYMTLSTGGL